MKVAIAGAGTVGRAIARDLRTNGHEILLIEKNREVIALLQPTLDVTWVEADACEMSSLDPPAWRRSTSPSPSRATTRTTS